MSIYSQLPIYNSIFFILKDLYERRNNEDGLFSVSDISMIKSYLGHFSHANSYNLVKKLEE